jgi:hypothetical protein
MRLLVLLFLLAALPGFAQNAAPAAAAQQPLAPNTPANSPPQPPSVTYQNGLLTIRAENSTLASVLDEVQSKTGAQIQTPPSAANERVVIQEGPAPPRAALISLLQGSGFDYIILGSPRDPQAVDRVVLTPHVASVATAQPAYSSPYGRSAEQNSEQNEDQQGATEAPTMPVPVPQAPPAVAAPPRQQQPGQTANGLKTPEQLLQELQQIQQGSQNQQNSNVQQTPRTPPQMPPRRVGVNPPGQ